jgi:hypothetical protein
VRAAHAGGIQRLRWHGGRGGVRGLLAALHEPPRLGEPRLGRGAGRGCAHALVRAQLQQRAAPLSCCLPLSPAPVAPVAGLSSFPPNPAFSPTVPPQRPCACPAK